MKKSILTLLFCVLTVSLACAEYDDIPESVKKQIIEQAEKNWPGDYDMQQHIIKKQFTAYKEVQKLKNK